MAGLNLAAEIYHIKETADPARGECGRGQAPLGHGGESQDQLLNLTTIPRLTRCASSLASQFVMRTQPCEAFLSIFEGSGVPCRP